MRPVMENAPAASRASGAFSFDSVRGQALAGSFTFQLIVKEFVQPMECPTRENEPGTAVSGRPARPAEGPTPLPRHGPVPSKEMDGWLSATWKEFNQKYFSGSLLRGEVVWGHVRGYLTLSEYDASTNRITLEPSVFPDEKRPWDIGTVCGLTYAQDELIHAMIHQACCQRWRRSNDYDWSQHYDRCMAEASRIAPLLKLAPPTSGFTLQEEFRRWPHSVRPLSDYDGDV